MGVPTLTLRGDRLLARQGAALLQAAGLEDWVAATPQDYVDQAVRRAAARSELAALRAGLREQVRASPLFDGALFAEHLAQAFEGMHQAATSAG